MFESLDLIPDLAGSCKLSSSDLFNDTYAVITCPSGMFLKTAAEVRTSCANSTRACPSTFTPVPTAASKAGAATVAVCICKAREGLVHFFFA